MEEQLSKLKKQIDKIVGLQSLSEWGPEYQLWKKQTENLVTNIFGQDYLKLFNGQRTVTFSYIDDTFNHRQYLKELDNRKRFLDGLISEHFTSTDEEASPQETPKNIAEIELLKGYLEKINDALSLARESLLKSESFYEIKSEIEIGLGKMKDSFGKKLALKIERTLPKWRPIPRPGMWVQIEEASTELEPLKSLIKELLENSGSIEFLSPEKLTTTNEVVILALKEAKNLVEAGNTRSAVDRVFTTLLGYIKDICKQADITYEEDSSLSKLFKTLKENHTAFTTRGSRQQDIDKVLRNLNSIMDALGPIRNRASMAHPNENLLAEEEAKLVINSANTILIYINEKLRKLPSK